MSASHPADKAYLTVTLHGGPMDGAVVGIPWHQITDPALEVASDDGKAFTYRWDPEQGLWVYATWRKP